jgi:hypothetical protein
MQLVCRGISGCAQAGQAIPACVADAQHVMQRCISLLLLSDGRMGQVSTDSRPILRERNSLAQLLLPRRWVHGPCS